MSLYRWATIAWVARYPCLCSRSPQRFQTAGYLDDYVDDATCLPIAANIALTQRELTHLRWDLLQMLHAEDKSKHPSETKPESSNDTVGTGFPSQKWDSPRGYSSFQMRSQKWFLKQPDKSTTPTTHSPALPLNSKIDFRIALFKSGANGSVHPAGQRG